MQPATILRLLESVDAFRRPERFEAMLVASACDFHGRPGYAERPFPEADRLRTALAIVPMITMRTFSEEKRSGTFELLLTSPLTDFQIVMGKFLGALGLYALMLAVSGLSPGLLFVYGNPEWRQGSPRRTSACC